MSVLHTELDDSLRQVASDLINQLGRSLLIRKPVRVENMTGANIGSVNVSPLSSSSLFINGSYSLGSNTIGLRATGLTGLLVANDSMSVDGPTYKVTGGPYAPDNSGVISSVTITPTLSTSISDGDAATIVFSGTEYKLNGAVETFSLALINSQDSSIQSGDFKVIFSKLDLENLGITITTKDELYNGPDATYQKAAIISADFLPSGQQDAALVIHARNVK